MAKRGVQGGQGQGGPGRGLPADQLAGQEREQLGGDGPEEPFDLSAALRAGNRALNQADVQVGADLAQMVAGEIAAMVGVQDVGQPADDPPQVGLGADGLPQRQRQVQRRRGTEDHDAPADRAGAVVDDHRQPRPGRVARR